MSRMVEVHPQVLAQLQERAARCSELESRVVEVVAELLRWSGEELRPVIPRTAWNSGRSNGLLKAAEMVAEKLGAKS
jgi:hypothetical protein